MRRSGFARGGARRNRELTPQQEIKQLRETVHNLQKDAQDQLSLEMESQASFEHIYAQVRGLRGAFDTLSDVLLEEVDSLRSETSKRFDSLSIQLEKHDRVLENACQDVSVLKRTIDVWGLKERDWAKDNEILKVSHAHNAEWMKTMQRDLMEVKDEMRAVKDESSIAAKDVREEASSLRLLWEQSTEKVNARVKELEASIDRQQVRRRRRSEGMEAQWWCGCSGFTCCCARENHVVVLHLSDLFFGYFSLSLSLSLSLFLSPHRTPPYLEQIEIRGMTDQRIDDYELLQKAMSTLQSQQVRLRSTVEEGGQANRVDIRSAVSKISQFDSSLASARMDSAELRRRLNDMDSDTHLQFQNVSRVFKVFSDALDISMPQLTTSSTSSMLMSDRR